MALSFIVTNAGTINAHVNGKVYTVPKDHRNYDKIKSALNSRNETEFVRQVDLTQVINKAYVSATGGAVRVDSGIVYFNNEPMHNHVTDRILVLLNEGFAVEPMVKFLDNLMKNPSRRAVQELYKFLEHKSLPITEDGCFLGYKSVNANYNDRHSNTFDNSIGKVLEVPRNTVDDEWRNACSSGFHVGSLEYVNSFHTYGSGMHVMIVKVNPADVVSVPSNEVTKLRTCKYEVVGEYDENLLKDMNGLQGNVYESQGVTPVTPTVPDNSGNTSTAVEDDTEDDEDDFEDDTEDDEDDFEDEDSDLEDEEEDDEWDSDIDDDEAVLVSRPTKDESELSLSERLILEIARKKDQPFYRSELESEVSKPSDDVHNREVRDAVLNLIDAGFLVPAGDGMYNAVS